MSRKQKKYHYIYKTTCSVTNRYYIGMHSTDDLDDGYIGSGKRLWFSINYHGKENHTKEILEFCENRAQLRQREEEIVNKQLINEELCMNLKTGGDGGIMNDEHHRKMREGSSKHQKEKWKDPEYSKIISESVSKTMSNTHKEGKIKYDTFTGKKHSEESKKKMSESKKGKGTGKANSQFGTCWITNGTETKKVKKEDLEQHLHNGWRTGRK